MATNPNPKWRQTIQEAGPSLAPVLQRIETQQEYEEKLSLCEWLLEEINNQVNHPLGPVLDTIVDRITDYENTNLPPFGQATDAIGMLRFLMDQHQLKQKDLVPLLGSAGITSEILSGKRSLNKHHIERLSAHFNISPALFFPAFAG